MFAVKNAESSSMLDSEDCLTLRIALGHYKAYLLRRRAEAIAYGLTTRNYDDRIVAVNRIKLHFQ